MTTIKIAIATLFSVVGITAGVFLCGLLLVIASPIVLGACIVTLLMGGDVRVKLDG
jgi:hypothetical protein